MASEGGGGLARHALLGNKVSGRGGAEIVTDTQGEIVSWRGR